MRRSIAGLAAAAMGLAALPILAGDIAPSAREICPLLVGEKLPALVLQTGDGADFDLNAAVASRPTVLIVYRGGW